MDLKKNTKELSINSRFDQLLFEISSRFVNLPANQVDKEINNALKTIVEFLDIDQSIFGEFKGEDDTLKIIHGYTSYKWQENRGILLNALAPNLTRQLRLDRVVNLPFLPGDLPEEWDKEREYVSRVGLKSCVGVSLNVGGSVIGVIIFECYRRHEDWTEQCLQHMRLLAQVFANALERKRTDEKLRKAFSKINELSERLKAENEYLRETLSSQGQYDEVIGQSRAIKQVLGKIEQVANTSSTVLFLGETGTGKTFLAQLVHRLSSRKNKTMLKVNCATLPANLLESELFGHEKGAFSGAISRKIGRFEIADKSTIFLDEIGELHLDLQAKLLRVLDDGEFERLGDTATIKVDVRILAATNRNLIQMVQEGKFRSDLYYRLNVYPIKVPPLRERSEDIPDIVKRFVMDFSKVMGRNIKIIPKKNLKALMGYAWPGNIRELKNVVENAMISTTGETLQIQAPELSVPSETQTDMSLEDAERSHIISVLEKTKWQIKGSSGAAEILKVNPSTLYSKMKKLGISPKSRQNRSF